MTKLENRNSKLAETESPSPARVKDFTDLTAWQLARELRKRVYDLTRRFPSEEKHVLSEQMRRAAISITANLAEGFGRFSYQENLQFCRQWRGSATELRDHLTTALDERYASQGEWFALDQLAQRVIQVLNGYLRATKARQGNVALSRTGQHD